MTKKQLILADLKSLASKLHRPPSRDEYRKKGKFSDSDIAECHGSWRELLFAAKLDSKSVISVVEKDGYEIARLKSDVERLLGYVKELEHDRLTTEKIREIIGATNTAKLGEGANWIKGPKELKYGVTGIPTLFISDIHFDEVVKGGEIGFVNEYNHQIAVDRIKHTFKMAVDLTKKYLHKPKYDGFICAFGGDLLSGNIHEELAETNAQTITHSIIDLSDLLADAISGLADEFGRVFCPCVVGNHGRLHKKPRYKQKTEQNYEWLIYQYLAKHFKNDHRVTFYIPDSPDAQWSVYGRVYNMNHGDQFKGGSGIAGLYSPLMLGMARKQKKQNAIGQPFDVMMNGHWHQYIHTDNLIVNGSIKGYDEFANGHNFSFEPPQQALFIAHPVKRETFRMPILCDKGQEPRKFKAPLSW